MVMLGVESLDSLHLHRDDAGRGPEAGCADERKRSKWWLVTGRLITPAYSIEAGPGSRGPFTLAPLSGN